MFDMSDEEYRAYLATSSSAFPTAVEPGEVRSKEDVLSAAKPKSAAKATAVKPKPGDEDGEDKKSHKGEPPPDKWAEFCKNNGMSCEPPPRNGGQEARGSRDKPSHPSGPDEPDSPKKSDRGNHKKQKKKSRRKKRTPTPSSSDSEDSSSDSSDDDSSSSSRKKKSRGKKKEKVKDCDEIRLDNTPHMGEFDEWVLAQRQRMITACKAHQDQTLQLLVSVEKAAREEVQKFRRLSLRLSTAVDKITKKSELGVKIAVLRKEQQERGNLNLRRCRDC
eukprot:6455993-Amphidinium_carterae.2